MALPISPISTNDIRDVLSVTGPSSFSALCNNGAVNAAGLDPTYCPGVDPAARLANLRSTPYSIGKFRGYTHSIFVDIQRISQDDPNYPGFMPGATWSWNQAGNWYDSVGTNAFEVSLGFDSSAGEIWYDASVADVSSWVTLKNGANDEKGIGSTVKPAHGNGPAGSMRVWPNSQNDTYEARSSQLVVVNNYGGQENWPIVQGAQPIPPPSINDWLEADISVLYTASQPMASLLGIYPDTYIRMFSNWKYVLTLTNVSTNTVNFGIDCSVAVISHSQYKNMEEGRDYPGPWVVDYYYSGSTVPLPSSINAGSTWSSGVIDIRGGGQWDSSADYWYTGAATDEWNNNEWWPTVYFTGYVGSMYNNVQVKFGQTDPALIHQIDVSLNNSPNPLSINFSKNGYVNYPISVDFMGSSWWNGPWLVSESLSWISITGSPGTGDGTFYITCDQQPDGGAYRSGSITFTADVAGVRTINVSQDSSISESMSAAPGTGSVTVAGGTLNTTVIASGAWTALYVSDPDSAVVGITPSLGFAGSTPVAIDVTYNDGSYTNCSYALIRFRLDSNHAIYADYNVCRDGTFTMCS